MSRKMSPSKTAFGTLIRFQRKKQKWTQKELARKLRSTQQYMSALEIGSCQSYLLCNEKLLKKLTNLFGCDFMRLQKIAPSQCRRENTTELGKLIRSFRLKRNFTQSEFGQKMQLSKQHVNQIECGRIKRLMPKTAQKVMRVLRCSIPFPTDFLVIGYRKKSCTAQAQAVRSGRLQLGISQEQLGKLINRTRSYVSAVEIGKIRLSKNILALLKHAHIL